jgi:hypothetical protein
MLFVDEQVATAPRARTPIDLPHAVARRPLADVGELDALALRAETWLPT